MPVFTLLGTAAVYLAGGGGDVTPIDTATTSVVSYILGYGVLGIVALALAFRFLVPGKALEKAREEARADLLKELERTVARAEKAEEQRDEYGRLFTDKVIPLMAAFTQATNALLPLLQTLVRYREDDRDQR